MYISFIDLKAAYDKIPRNLLFRVLDIRLGFRLSLSSRINCSLLDINIHKSKTLEQITINLYKSLPWSKLGVYYFFVCTSSFYIQSQLNGSCTNFYTLCEKLRLKNPLFLQSLSEIIETTAKNRVVAEATSNVKLFF